MVKHSVEERRKASRAKRILSIQYRMIKSKHKDGDKRWHLSTTHDMSILGLSFLSDVPYHIDDTLEIHVIMSGILDIYKGYGKVVRVERKETGAYFLIAVKFVKHKSTASKVRAVKPKNRIRKAARK